MFVYTIDDIIGIAIIAIILIAFLFTRLINWIYDKMDKS
jgi:hypothetical protein